MDMKFAKKMIPTPPRQPKAPSPPSKSGMPDNAAGGSGTDSIPGGMPDKVGMIMKKIGMRQEAISGAIAARREKIQKFIREFPLDKYRDENGVVRCPVPKADREALVARMKKIAESK